MKEKRTKEQTIGFIGLGNMGLPIARNLLNAGYQLRVFNRTKKRAAPLAEQGAELVDSPNEVAEKGGVVFSMLADDDAVQSVSVKDTDFLGRLGPGGIHISMSTISPAAARQLTEQHSKHDVSYLGAPVVGRPDRAAAGKLFILLAGKHNPKERVLPMLGCIGERVFDFGENPWSSNVAKLALNFNIVAAIECMAESFTFAEKNGIRREQMADLLFETVFGCVVYKGYGQHVARHNYEPAGFRLKLGWKDLRLALQIAEESATPIPIGSFLRDRMLSALAKDRGDMDWSAIALGASEDAGLARKTHA
jgi:3-hydroxyisobutyrate dehydrogenase-like beta-hydroxyacid dehydrogenase